MHFANKYRDDARGHLVKFLYELENTLMWKIYYIIHQIYLK